MLGFNPLASAPLSDDGGIAFEDGPRITESGDTRITESGDSRVTENFTGETHVGASSLTASSSIAAVGTRVHPASAALTTQGSAVYASTASFRGAASLTASSSIAAAAEVFTNVSASIDLRPFPR